MALRHLKKSVTRVAPLLIGLEAGLRRGDSDGGGLQDILGLEDHPPNRIDQ